MRILILLCVLIPVAVCGQTKTKKQPPKVAKEEVNILDRDNIHVRTLWKAGYFQRKVIDSCHYIVRSTVTGDAMAHAGNCPNHKVIGNK